MKQTMRQVHYSNSKQGKDLGHGKIHCFGLVQNRAFLGNTADRLRPRHHGKFRASRSASG
jgi:hypothetical protein